MEITSLPDWLPDEDGLITHYIKLYPDRIKVIRYKTPYAKEQNQILTAHTRAAWLQDEEITADSLLSSIQRSKTRLADLVICNEFNLFVTLTLNCIGCVPKCKNRPCTCDKKTCTRYNLDYAIRTVKGWYNNQIKKHGRFPYVQVMELHKDKGYHFHALFKDYPGNLKYWKRDNSDGRPLYNLQSYRKGWTTAKKIYDISGTSSYIRKYIMKDMPLFPGQKRYWCSQGLKRPIIVQDDQLAEQILSDLNSETWKPAHIELTVNDELKTNTSNIESITTLMVDNKQNYEYELQVLECLEDITKNFGK